MAGNLAPPDLVEVISSDAVDPAMAAITEELDDLETELVTLSAKADQLELQAAEARRSRDDSSRALTLLEQVFAARAAETRAEMDAALEAAKQAAERRVATALDDVDGADATSGVPAGDRRFGAMSGPPSWEPQAAVEEVLRVFDEARAASAEPLAAVEEVLRVFGESRRASASVRPPEPPAAETPPPVPASPAAEADASQWASPHDRNGYAPGYYNGLPADVAPLPQAGPEQSLPQVPVLQYAEPQQVEPEPDPAPVSVPVPDRSAARPMSATTALAAKPSEPGAARPAPADRFAQFWVPDDGLAVAAPRRMPALIDIILPVIAAAIVLMVVLSWIG